MSKFLALRIVYGKGLQSHTDQTMDASWTKKTAHFQNHDFGHTAGVSLFITIFRSAVPNPPWAQ